MSTSFEDIGFMLMDVAKLCNVDAARIITGQQPAVDLSAPDQTGFYVVATAGLHAPDGTAAALVLLNTTPRVLRERERIVLRALAQRAEAQMT